MDGQVTWLDLGISCGKTWSEPLAATKEKTSTPCWRKLRVSQNQDFLYLDCRTSGNGQKQEPSTVMGGLSLGELTTLRTGEKPSETAVQEMLSVWGPHSVAEESRLSQILEEKPLPKYNLSAKACLGILRRAERRGKDLPERLKAALLMQSASGGGGCDGGGKGTLVQTEKSGTLGTGNDQTIFAAIPINDKATRWQGGGESRNHDGSGNGLGVGKEGDPSPTLTAGDRHGVMCMTPWDAQSQRVYDGDGVSPTLTSRENSGLNREAVLCAGFKAGQGAQAGGIGYSEEVSPTLAAAPSGTNQTPAVVALDMTHACDVIRECGEQVPALQARMGTGGNQVPLTYQMNGFGDYRAGEVASSCKQRDFKDSTDLVCSSVDFRNFREGGEVNGMLQAKESSGQSLNLNNTVRQHMVVRRLTPLECERLQGFPDGWTDIGDWVKTDKRGREIKVKGSADSPRYKALGNSIALPFWDWMLRRMAQYLPEDATMGSLFDGIGGFPLCFERIHGKGTARWASEIEPFSIAVTKKWFGEE